MTIDGRILWVTENRFDGAHTLTELLRVSKEFDNDYCSNADLAVGDSRKKFYGAIFVDAEGLSPREGFQDVFNEVSPEGVNYGRRAVSATVIEQLKEANPFLPVVAYGPSELEEEMIESGAVGYVCTDSADMGVEVAKILTYFDDELLRANFTSLGEQIKVHDLTIYEGAHLVQDNSREFTGQEIGGTCGGLPFASDNVYIFPVGDKDVVYVYHQRGERVQDMADISYAKILGYFAGGEIELNRGERVSFDELNPTSHHGGGHSGKVMHLYVACEDIPQEDYSLVREACPVGELPAEYREN